MYANLKSLVNVPYQIKHFIKRSGTGIAEYEEPVDELCYPSAEIVSIKDSKGIDTVSSSQLYIEGSTDIDVKDRVVFEGSEKSIISIKSFYRNGKPDCKVVYL